MRRFPSAMVLMLVLAQAAPAEGPSDKVVRDVWDAAYLEGGKIGFFHTVVREVERDGKKLLRTTVELDLSVKRGPAVARLRMQTGSDETADGKVLGVVMRQFLGADQQLLLTGVVEGDQLHVKTSDAKVDKLIPWNDKVVGLARQERIYQENKVKPGDTISYLSYEPTIASVVTVRATVKDMEEVEVLGGKKRKMLRVESQPDKVQAANANIQLPGMTLWLDEELMPARMQMEMPGLGQMVLYRTAKDAALAAGPPPKAGDVDLLSKNLLQLNRTLNQPHQTKAVTYRITLKGDDDPTTAFTQDDRQIIQNVKGRTFDLVVKSVRQPGDAATPPEAKKEFVESNYFLNSESPLIKDAAVKAVGKETDPFRKAQLIERWLRQNVSYDNAAPFAPADKIITDCKGDCRHAGMLGAAMSRAVGVPSRTAVGLVYTEDRRKGPVLAFHMWFEVFVKGQWVALDGTLGLGSVGAGHVKIADSSWHDVQSLTPFLPVSAVLGKVEVEIVKAE